MYVFVVGQYSDTDNSWKNAFEQLTLFLRTFHDQNLGDVKLSTNVVYGRNGLRSLQRRGYKGSLGLDRFQSLSTLHK